MSTLPTLPNLQYPKIDAAIAQFEGFNTQGTPAQLNNNPGNIIAGPFATQHGATGSSGVFANFPDVATGAAAEDALVQQYANKGATVQDLITGWAPPTAPGNSPQATQNYINSVSKALGISPSTPVSSISQSPTTQTQTPAQSGCLKIGSVTLGCLGKKLGGPGAAGMGSSTSVGGFFDLGRLGMFILGIVVIAGAIFLFKPVREVVTKTVKGKLAAGGLMV